MIESDLNFSVDLVELFGRLCALSGSGSFEIVHYVKEACRKHNSGDIQKWEL